MRLVVYSVSIGITVILFFYGMLGILDTAVSYKYEIDDPSVEITLQKLVREEQRSAYIMLKEKKGQLELQEYFFTVVITLSILTFILLICFRKRILQKRWI